MILALVCLLRTILVLKPKLPCPGNLLSPMQIRTFCHPSGRWSLNGFSYFPPGGHIYLLSKTFCSYFSISNNLKTPSLFSFCPGSLDNFFLVTSLASLSFFYCHQLGLYRLFLNHCKTSMKSPCLHSNVCAPLGLIFSKPCFAHGSVEVSLPPWSLTSSLARRTAWVGWGKGEAGGVSCSTLVGVL